MAFANQILTLKSEALGEDALVISKLVGEERLSGSFRFELELLGSKADAGSLDLDALLYKPAQVGIRQPLKLPGGGTGMRTLWYGGVLTEIEQLGAGKEWVEYRAVLVPRLRLLDEFWRSRIFQDVTIPELVARLLQKGELGLAPDSEFDLSGVTRAPEGSKRLGRDVYPAREYVVQYEESDYAFLLRWLEQEGIFFYFDNDGSQEKVVFGDTVGAYRRLSGTSAFPFRPEEAAGKSGDESGNEEVNVFNVRQERLPKQVRLRDYNWRIPSAALTSEAEVYDHGLGVQHEYNDHYKTVGQGKALATVRAEERRWRRVIARGRSTCRGFRPGRMFSLKEHFVSGLDGDYVLTAVRHEATQMISLDSGSVSGADYHNTFEAIPADVVFRPPCLTPWPAIKGVMHARIDGEEDGYYAQLDSQGRYKVTIPFDDNVDDASPGKASRWVRMAQPYAGIDSGFHFPLLKGTEVLLTHIDGDPDRPIIAAAVPNPETTSPVDQHNAHQNRIQSTSGNLFMMDDHSDSNGFVQIDGGGRRITDQRMPLPSGEGSTGPGPGYGGAASRRPSRSSGAPPAPAATPPGPPPAPVPLTPPGASMLRYLVPAGGPLPEAILRRFRAQEPGPGQANPETYDSLDFPGSQITTVNTEKEVTLAQASAGEFGTKVVGYDVNGDGLADAGATASSKNAVEVTKDLTGLEYFVNESNQATTANAALKLFSEQGLAPAEASKHHHTGVTLPHGLSYLLEASEWGDAVSLSYEVGDTMSIRDCGPKATSTDWEYSNVSNSISFGTGGYSYSQDGTPDSPDAHNTSVEYHYGDNVEYAEHHGDSHSTEKHYGNSTSHEWNHGWSTSASFTFGESASFDLTVAAVEETEIFGGGKNSNSVAIGLQVETDIYLLGKASFEIYAAFISEITIGAALRFVCEIQAGGKFTITGMPEEEELNLTAKNEFSLEKAELKLQALETKLDQTKITLNQTQTHLNRTNTNLKETNARLDKTEANLKEESSTLSYTMACLNSDLTLLKENVTALSKTETTLDNTQTSLSHKIQ